jgi:hypothetical protein
MTDAVINKTEAAVLAAKKADPGTITRSRKPEGSFALFLMDFDISGTQKSLYPAIIKQYRGSRGTKLAENATKDDYIAARYAIGRARKYIIEALGLPVVTDTSDFTPLKTGKYEKLVIGGSTAAHDPEKSAVVIQSGKPVRIGLSGVIEQTGVEGQTQNVPIVGPIQLRIPTLVSIRQFVAWLNSAKGPSDKSKLSYVLLAGGRQVPISGGAVQPSALIDGPG